MTSASRSPQPRLTLASVLWVLSGGALGAGSRQALALAFPLAHQPWVIMAINVAGAFLLGVLLSSTPSTRPDAARRIPLRLFLGTGFLGGFTTYSALSTYTAIMLDAGEVVTALGHAVGTVLAGAFATMAGVVIGSRRGGTKSAGMQA